METKVFNNTSETLKDDLVATITKGSKVSIAAACFSIYAYKELKKQLSSVSEFRFIFTSPTFSKESDKKENKEFFIQKLNREKSLCGTEFEVKLRNEMTQKSIAKECAEWIKKKAIFKTNTTREDFNKFLAIENDNDDIVYHSLKGFTSVDIGCERGKNLFNLTSRLDTESSKIFIKNFEAIWNDKEKLQDVTKEVIESITTAYKENSPEFIYFMTLYHVFSEFLQDVSEDNLPNEANGFKKSNIWNKLYDFQQDAVLSIINKLEKFNGCILADSVGLGKTFTALAVIKYYLNRNKSILVLCPKKLEGNWNTYKDNYVNNPLLADRIKYDVLFHSDLNRKKGTSNGIDLERINWGNYDLVVIDESHNFRNGNETYSKSKTNRYQSLLDKVIRVGVKTKVLMLSATPVNNRFIDLKNQLAIAYEGDPDNIDSKLDTNQSIDEIFKQAQREYSSWCKLPQQERTTDALLQRLDLDFFKVLDSVTIARSRKHIEKYYNVSKIGKFPERNKPVSLRPSLSDLNQAINYKEIYALLKILKLSVYKPSSFIFPSKLEKYANYSQKKGLTQSGREEGIRVLMSTNLLKRLESSVNSFNLTLLRIKNFIDATIQTINKFEKGGNAQIEGSEIDISELDGDDENSDLIYVGTKVKIDLADMDYVSWRDDLKKDADTLDLLISMVNDITPEHDSKLQELLNLISNKIENPINNDNKKVLIFSAFSDTAEYLYDNVSSYIKEKYGLDVALVTGAVDGRTTIKGFKCSLNNTLTCFSPKSKEHDLVMPNDKNEITVLIATDCISEGQNLQDCDFVINYDIHWNPVRIIQRFGRVDRIGSNNKYIQLVNFWPDVDLDEYIRLKPRVESKMKITVMTSTGDDDLINLEEKGDLEYRKEQLKRMQNEVVNIEDMSNGMSIMDLGLNEFRQDLLEYLKHCTDIESKPTGLHAVVESTKDLPKGVIFVLKNINDDINIDKKNRIHPFYMVYIRENGEVVCDYLSPKKTLDDMRLLCKGQKEPINHLCNLFNLETKDGKNMTEISNLLGNAINSIIERKQESDIDSLFSSGGTSALLSKVTGLDDFELICFLVVK